MVNLCTGVTDWAEIDHNHHLGSFSSFYFSQIHVQADTLSNPSTSRRRKQSRPLFWKKFEDSAWGCGGTKALPSRIEDEQMAQIRPGEHSTRRSRTGRAAGGTEQYAPLGSSRGAVAAPGRSWVAPGEQRRRRG
jgi:hypothetical protein